MKLALIKLFAMGVMACMVAACGSEGGPETVDVTAGDEPTPYPLDACAVSGKKIETIESPFTFVYKNLEILVADESLKAQFEADPEKYIAQIREQSGDEEYGKAPAPDGGAEK